MSSKTKPKRRTRPAEPVEYRPIPDLPGYRISDRGDVQSCWGPGRYSEQTDTWVSLTPHEQDGRLRVRIRRRREQTRRSYQIAELVLRAFVGPPPDDATCHVRFADGDPRNMHVGNLRWSGEQQRL